jgi:hypothetical protein
MVEHRSVHAPPAQDGRPGDVVALRNGAHALPHPSRGASLVTGALVVGAVVGGRAGYRLGTAISHRHDGRRT